MHGAAVPETEERGSALCLEADKEVAKQGDRQWQTIE